MKGQTPIDACEFEIVNVITAVLAITALDVQGWSDVFARVGEFISRPRSRPLSKEQYVPTRAYTPSVSSGSVDYTR